MEVGREYYVYYLKHKKTNVVFYVGSTKMSPEQRLSQHLQQAKCGWAPPVSKHIRKLLVNNQQVILEKQMVCLTKNEAREIESRLIYAFRKDNLTNVGQPYGKSKRKAANRREQDYIRFTGERLRSDGTRPNVAPTTQHVSSFKATNPS